MINELQSNHGLSIPSAYLPNFLRKRPLVLLKDEALDFVVPIPEILTMRVTSGLYYDLIGGGQDLLNEASDRFEEYCAAYVRALMPRFMIRRAYRYDRKKGATIDTPDVLVEDRGKVMLVVECKASKLTYLAQISEDPFEAAKKQFLQLAKGVFQLWRFFSHVRRGILSEVIDNDTAAMVITLDPFYPEMYPGLSEKIYAEAAALADKEGEINSTDRRRIVFCPISELEAILSRSTEDGFLATLSASRIERYERWRLREICRDQGHWLSKDQRKKYPFSLDELLPWWRHLEDYRQLKRASG